MKISIQGGEVTAFADEIETKGLEFSKIDTKRVSHIYPKNKLLKMLFVAIRSAVKNDSKAAEWTRGWNVIWQVHYKDKIYGEYLNRNDAIKFEKDLVWKDLKGNEK